MPDIGALLSSLKLYSCWVSGSSKKSCTLLTLSNTQGLRVARPHRNPDKPCYSAPYSLAHSQHWGGSVFSPLPLGLTWSLQGREPLPRNSFSQLHVTTPGREGERMHLQVGGRELRSFHSLTECSAHSTPTLGQFALNLVSDPPWTWGQWVTAEGLKLNDWSLQIALHLISNLILTNLSMRWALFLSTLQLRKLKFRDVTYFSKVTSLVRNGPKQLWFCFFLVIEI